MTVERVSPIDAGALLTVDFLIVDANLEAAWQSRQTLETTQGPLLVWSDAEHAGRAAASDR